MGQGKRIRTGVSGFTMVEVMVALVLVMIALSGYSRSLVSSMVASDTNEELRIASEAARVWMERLQGTDFDEVWARYGHSDAAFPVAGLAARGGDQNGDVLFLDFPIIGNSNSVLREDANIPALGLPRDLNADGVVDSEDHSDDYVILPIRVRLEWEGSRGDGYLEFQTLLSGF